MPDFWVRFPGHGYHTFRPQYLLEVRCYFRLHYFPLRQLRSCVRVFGEVYFCDVCTRTTASSVDHTRHWTPCKRRRQQRTARLADGCHNKDRIQCCCRIFLPTADSCDRLRNPTAPGQPILLHNQSIIHQFLKRPKWHSHYKDHQYNTITVCTVVQYCCKGRSKKYRKWPFSGRCRRETP